MKKVWTRFMDMHSGGWQKEKFAYCYIEAPEQEAKVIFYNRFGRNPDRVTCTCCGNDYSIYEVEDLQQGTAFERGCKYDEETKQYVEEKGRYGRYGRYVSLKDYLAEKDVCVIYAKDIKDEERHGDVPQQGYVWQD